MAEKDIAEKTLQGYNDVFADIVNVLLFNGKQIVEPDVLIDALPTSQYKVDGKLHEQDRDVAKYWKNSNIKIAFYGVENQTSIDKDMPLRIISYDGAAYRNQLNEKKYLHKAEKRYPVVTIVLNFSDKRWRRNRSLAKCLGVPQELEPFVSDYKINVFDIPYLSDEQVKLFKSDFKIVADYFVQMRKNKTYVPSQDKLVHVREVLTMLSVLTGDARYEEAFSSFDDGDFVGGVNMCKFLDELEARGVAIGEARGKAIGEARGEDNFARLTLKLKELGRVDELFQAAADAEFRAKLMKEFSIA